MKRMVTKRRGASLPEVLVAVVVLSIGLTSVVALFPVGISRIRNATLDTRTTIMASNAINTFNIKRMANDPAIIDWPVYDNNNSSSFSSFIFKDPYRNPTSYIPYAPGNAGWATSSGTAVIPTDGWGYVVNLVGQSLPTPNRSTSALTTTDISNATNYANNSLFCITASSNQVEYPGGSVAVSDMNAGYDKSYPVLLDPWLYDQMAFQFGMMDTATGLFPAGLPRIPISTVFNRADGTPIPGVYGYYAPYVTSGAMAPFGDIAVLSLSEVTLLPPSFGTNAPLDRDMVKTRWFSSLSDVQYSTETVGQIVNPSSSDYMTGNQLSPQNYYEAIGVGGGAPTTSNPIRATSSRTYEYSWAAMFQRKLVADSVTTGVAARPNPSDREFRGKVSILSFYRRNLQQPFSIIEGCFYNGSRRATLSWPNGYPAAPTINIGTWLCEASISRSTVNDALIGSFAAITAQYPQTLDLPATYGGPVKRIYRRSYSFHQVTEVTEPQMLGNRVYVQVTLARPALGYPLRYQNPGTLAIGSLSGQDDRGIDPYPAVPTWPIFDRSVGIAPNFDDETNCSQADSLGIARTDYSPYFPVIIFDGLREVFEYEQ